HLGWFGSRTSKYILNLLKEAEHKERLTTYIRQFESVVVQALKFYTVSVDVNVYKAVISLLVQLIQIRVNYCLLDNNQRFIAFLFQQLENMGDLSNAIPRFLAPCRNDHNKLYL
uniref:Uncharacterized protein n=1 Tax=Romanomermis culicivorax TaxID=13658 RepID=A0A915JVS0_ROMCU